jgi:outer membrane lipoprotein carrier protein
MRYLWMGLLLLAFHVQADQAALDALSARLSAVGSLRADFEQTLLSTEGRVLEQSSGKLLLLQPGYFRWHILEPDEQLLIAAEGTLWHYDVDLETITRRNVPADNSHTPLAILGGSGEALAEQYRVDAVGSQSWRLEPRSENANFTALVLQFDGDRPVLMTVEDPLLRSTEIRFVNTELNPLLTADDFFFEPPPGVDVYLND